MRACAFLQIDNDCISSGQLTEHLEEVLIDEEHVMNEDEEGEDAFEDGVGGDFVDSHVHPLRAPKSSMVLSDEGGPWTQLSTMGA